MRFLRATLAVGLGLALVLPVGASGSTMARLHDPKPGTTAAVAAKLAALKSAHRTARPVAAKDSVPTVPGAVKTGAIDGVWIVRAETPAERSDAAARVSELGGSVARFSRTDATSMLVKLPSARQSAIASSLRGDETIATVRQAVRVAASGVASVTPTDPDYPVQWGLRAIGAPYAWATAPSSTEVTIAVIDTGVDYRHPDLASHLDTANAFDFVNNDRIATDDEGHGTHVAGIAAGIANDINGLGVAPTSPILPIKVLDAYGRGTDFDVSEGIRWAADHGAKVLNLSLGTSDPSQELVDAVGYAEGKGCVVVASAGNEGFMQGGYPSYGSSRVGYPAALDGVIAVGASTINDTVVAWSSRGPEVDVVAPGTNILSTKRGGGMVVMSGTSMASPMVAGACALLLAQHPGWTSAQVQERLQSTAVDLGRSGKDIDSGYGRINLARALDDASPGGVTIERTAADADDDVPGVPLPAATTTGTIDADTDVVDAYRIHLEAGEKLAASITQPVKGAAAIQLYQPDTTSLYSFYAMSVESVGGESPTSFQYVAPRAGDFYISVIALKGKGAYSLSTSISKAVPNKHVFPGVSATPTTSRGRLTGTLDELDVTDDYYHLNLKAGERLAVKLDGPKRASTYMDVTLSGPDSWDGAWGLAWGSYEWWPELPASALPFTSGTFLYEADKTGDYTLHIYLDEGYGPYTVTWQIVPAQADDVLPGVPVAPGATSATGTLEEPFDRDDVRSIDLVAGQRFDASLVAPKTGDQYLVVYGPGSKGLEDYSHVMAADWDAISFTVPETGTYSLVTETDAGYGAYKVSWATANATDQEITATASPLRPAYGVPVRISVHVAEAGSGVPAAGQAVQLQEDAGWGWGFEALENKSADASGNVTFTVPVQMLTKLRVATIDGFTEKVVSDEFTVKPGVKIDRPTTSAKTVFRGVKYTWSGKLRPQHYPRARSVKLRFQRNVGGKWVTYSEQFAANTNPASTPSWDESDADSYTVYKLIAKVPERGRWRIAAVHPEDPEHAGTISTWTYVTVR